MVVAKDYSVIVLLEEILTTNTLIAEMHILLFFWIAKLKSVIKQNQSYQNGYASATVWLYVQKIDFYIYMLILNHGYRIFGLQMSHTQMPLCMYMYVSAEYINEIQLEIYIIYTMKIVILVTD